MTDDRGYERTCFDHNRYVGFQLKIQVHSTSFMFRIQVEDSYRSCKQTVREQAKFSN